MHTTMNLYTEYLFPRIMDWIMSGQEFARLRSDLLRDACGEVLEIGYGTGLNLPHYPAGVSRLTMVDPVRLLPSRVKRRSAGLPFPVVMEQGGAESLAFPDQRFDTVVSTWTLCTIPDAQQALREISRVLRPMGRFLFVEHGRSDDPRVAAWQDRLNPLQRFMSCGCNLNRPIHELVQRSGLGLIRMERFHMPHAPRLVGEMYRGHAAPRGIAD
jgi:ubiquinone/menaquinone biosynthesis C-methylase UbiE